MNRTSIVPIRVLQRSIGRLFRIAALGFCILPAAAAQTVDVDRYAWEFPDVSKPRGAEVLVAELQRLVQQVLDSGHLAPISLRFADQLGGAGEGYLLYQEPGRIITTLAWAWPHVREEQRAGIRALVRMAFSDARFAPWSAAPASRDEGSRRELHLRDRDWHGDNTFGARRSGIHMLYGIWLYGHRSGDWSAIAPHWPAISAAYTARAAQAVLYGTMGAHVAMARMAERFDDTAMRATALQYLRNALSEGRDFTVSEEYARSRPDAQSAPYAEMYEQRRSPYMYHGWMFLNLAPEIGRYLREHVAAAVLDRHRVGLGMYPLWWLMQSPYFCRWTGDEGVGLPSEIVGMIAPIERWVAQSDAATLSAYCRSAPTGVGDCYWMEMLVQAIEAHGSMSWIDVRAAYDRTPPAAVLDLHVAESNAQGTRFEWTAPGDDGDSGRASEYVFRVATDSITDVSWEHALRCYGLPDPDTAGTGQYYLLRDQLPGTRYWAAIRSVDDEGGMSPVSRSVVWTTARSSDTLPPPAPALLRAEACGRSQILLTWTGTSDASGIRWYEVERDSVLLAAVAYLTAFEDRGLRADSEHRYRVRAVDRGGNRSIWSSPATARTATVRNVLVNGGFESGTLAGWQDQGGIDVTPGAAYDGAHGARMDSTGRIDQVFATRIGAMYHTAARVRIDRQLRAPDWGGITVSVVDTSWRTLGESDRLTATTVLEGAWTTVSFSWRATSTASRIIFQNFSQGRFFVSADDFIVSPDSIPGDCPDRLPPAVTITYPTVLDTLGTDTASILLAGLAHDASVLRAVRWVNSRGGSGLCEGSTQWSVRVALASGLNMLVVTAEDAEGNRGADTLRVTRGGGGTGEAPRITMLHAGPGTVPMYTKYEVAFAIASSGILPYTPFAPSDDGYAHPDGITAEARITTPTGAVHMQPAYLHEPYLRSDIGAREAATGIAGKSEWRVRYSPMERGMHRVQIVVEDRNGRTEAAPFDFAAVGSDAPGFLRVSQKDTRLLVYDDGTPFIPIAEGRQWAPKGWDVVRGYETAFAADAAAGVNLTRIWDQNDGFNLAIEGSYTRWSPAWSQFARAVRIDTKAARSGVRCARFSAVGGRVTEGYTQAVAVLPSTAYTLSGWIRCDSLDGAVFLAADASSTSSPGYVRTDTVRGTMGWTRVERRFTTGGAQTHCVIWAGAETSVGDAYFDDLELIRDDGDGANLLPDPGFERQFTKDDAGNDPEDPATARNLPKGTWINQWAAFELDAILDAAAREGIAVQLCAHGDVYWTWNATVYDSRYARENGYTRGWLDAGHLGYWKRNLRYRIARWGYSTALLAWEIWNEHGTIRSSDSVALFYRELAAFTRAQDAHKHLFTTSQGSQTHSPEFWYTPDFDLINYHDYITTAIDRHAPALRDDEVLFVYRLAADLAAQRPASAAPKPFLWGEIGTLRTWDHDEPLATEGEGGQITRHNFLWAGLFSPLLTSPIDWQAVEKVVHTRALRKFLRGEPFDTARWRCGATSDLAAGAVDTLGVSHPLLRALTLTDSAARRILGWVHNRGHIWSRVARDGLRPDSASGAITVPRLMPGSYDVQWWHTRDTSAPRLERLEHRGGAVSLVLPRAITDDIAFKIVPHEVTSVGPPAPARDGWPLLAVHPHPVVSDATITFTLDAESEVDLALYDALGRRVAVCVQRTYTRGEHRVRLGTRAYAHGLYRLILETNRGRVSRPLLVLPR